MGVSVDDGFDFKALFFSHGHNLIDVMAGVDHQCFAGLFAADDLSVVVHVSDGELFYEDCLSSADVYVI